MQNYRKQFIGRGSDGLVHHPIKHRQIRRAFTLVELLVVIAIIALLLGILIPAVSHARRNAEISATNRSMNNAAFGIKTYHNDFNAYPPSDKSKMTGSGTTFGVTPTTSMSAWTGAELLAQAMVGPLPDTDDNHTGPGWAKSANAKVYGPYLSTGEHSIKKDTTSLAPNSYVLIDSWDQAIQYYKADMGAGTSAPLWGANARFNRSDNEVTLIKVPAAVNQPADDSVLQSAKFLLISIGPDSEISTSDPATKTLDSDNVVVTGP